MIIDQFAESSVADFADKNHIGIAGFSLGGTTAIWIAGGRSTKLDTMIPGPEYIPPEGREEFSRVDEALPTLNKEKMAQDWRDVRVKAAFIMAPSWGWIFDEKSLGKISIPTYIIASTADHILITRNNAQFFARHIPRSVYQEIPGKANHCIFISALNEKQKKGVDPTGEFQFLLEDDVSIDRSWIQLQVSEEAVRFFTSVFEY